MRASKTGGHPKPEQGQPFLEPTMRKKNIHRTEVYPRVKRRNKRNQDCNSFGKRESCRDGQERTNSSGN